MLFQFIFQNWLPIFLLSVIYLFFDSLKPKKFKKRTPVDTSKYKRVEIDRDRYSLRKVPKK